MPIKAISFDLDDTFWPILPTILNAEKVTKNWLARNYPGVEKFLSSSEIMKIRDELVSSSPHLAHQLSELRSLIFAELGLRAGYGNKESAEIASKSFEIFFEERNNVTLYKGVKETLERLNKRFSLGVITNGNADLEKIGLSHLFDFFISASEVSVGKPDPKIFQAFIEKTDLDAEEICHVGDHPINDVQASMNIGMKAVWFNEKKIDWPLNGIKVKEINEWSELEGALQEFI